jgi:3-oxoacyl-[acyl-carrier protein] reductase
MTAAAKRVALVSGATRGIGREIAQAFLELGVDVVALHRRPLPSDTVLDPAVRPVQCDVTDFARVREVVSELEAVYGQIHYLVNNAGVTRDRSLFQMELDDWNEVLVTNLTGAFHLCRAAVLKMMKRQFGRIVNVTSVSGLVGAAGQCNYAASKAGLIGLTKSIAREVATFGVTCNAIAPGYVETDMTAALPDRLKERARAAVPAGRFGRASEMRSAIRFLAADDSSYVNGAVITIDGGMI